MPQIGANELKPGVKVEIDNQPFVIVSSEFIKPGKGQAFTRVRVKNLFSGKVIEKTYKSNEKLEEADVTETKMRMLYKDANEAVFMDDNTYEQHSVPLSAIEDVKQCKPIYKEFNGWSNIDKSATKLSDLPKEAQNYLKFIEKELKTPISIVSIGPGRKETIEV